MIKNTLHSVLGAQVLAALTLIALISAPLSSTLAAEADSPAGSVKSFTGQAQVARHGAAPAPLNPGDRIFEKDVLTTGKDSSLGLVMRDNSVVSLGPGSRLVVERFLFAPEKGALASILRVAKGSSAMVTGEIAKLSPNSMKVYTPTATIGIRGTHFLVNVEDGAETAPAEAGGR
ncbi:MAG: FecR family protein [Proteobacteria bacterium]|nr:FecR family protein [Pseudomonadota bacterium]